MFDSDEKITSLLVKINRLTSMDKVQWRVEEPPRPLSRGTDDFIPFFLAANYKGQAFGLYQKRYQSYDGERDRFYWNEREVLAILDYEGRALWETTRQYSALSDLFETAKRKVANVDGIIEDLLNDEGN